ncbi:ABC-F family ATP-binding cassette domain-containing protein [Streptomyces hydrogenans]|uniref:ABC transporter ATP-binding protein n=1 Tax=Streptomyces hydrogenans TaxID=1873719 RepID=A0ABQ3P4F9_9ACTN|nr:ATP-binding cassette domain-containing protein [Streptomyces hydrogenans]GHG02031.1 ABC transporter ATP-binding protein [Streptomyces hydrogenans]GHI19907.1 ABC transporter ATP-binding protein [Streptomyces hydrogenans]
MPAQISLHDVTVSRGERLLLDDVSLAVRPGERVGIVGENGAGKSTLLHLLAGRIAPHEGRVTVLTDGGLRLVHQTPELPPEDTVADAVDAALADLRAMEARLRALEARLDRAAADDLAAYGELLTAYELRGGYEADARVDKALHALGIAHIARDRRLGSLSGGEQARLGIACAIAAAPEVLLLDEPTNHLDAGALDWLEESLRSHRGTIVAVSHDRVFLEGVTTALVEVDTDRKALVRHGEGYAGFRAAHEATRRRRRQEYEEWRAETERLEAYAEGAAHSVAAGRDMKDNNKMAYDRAGGRVQASVSGRVRNARERLRRLRAEPVSEPAPPLAFTARPQAGAAHGELLALRGVRVDERLAVDDLTLRAGERLLVHGENGAGKSTLLRVMAGRLTPDAGEVRRQGRIGFLSQEVTVRRPAEPLLTAFGHGLGLGLDEDGLAERLLSYGLFRPDDLIVPLGALSAGQLRRLALARLLARPADLLLLDEPANHLALGLVEELERALEEWPGALVVVSHDRGLRRAFTGRIRRMDSGRLLD